MPEMYRREPGVEPRVFCLKSNHWVLFKKLINRSVPIYLVKVLCIRYQHQSMYVKWGSTLSSKFQVTNDVRQ